MKRYVMLLTLVAGLLFCGSQAFGLPILAENFNDVTNPLTNVPLVAADNPSVTSIVAAHASQLPAGTTGTGSGGNATAASVNVRSQLNSIDLPATTPANFQGFFTSNFLVVGDNTGSLFREAWSTTTAATSLVTIPFTNPSPGGTLDVSFNYAFNGWDNLGNKNQFRVYLSDGTTQVNLINYFSTARVTPVVPPANYLQGIFQLLGIDSSVFAGPSLTLNFMVYEFALPNTNNGGLGNVAAGIDDIVINYTEKTVPEPSTFLLLGVGLGGLTLLRRRRG